MLAAIDIAPPRIGADSLLLSVGEDRRITILQGTQFAGRPIGDPPAIISSILPLEEPLVNSAIAVALDGHQQTVFYYANLDGRIVCIDLHCFPGWSGNRNEVVCHIIDRTGEKMESDGLREKVILLDMVSQVVGAFAETRNLTEILRIILLGVTAGPGLGFNRGFVLLANEARSNLWGCLATGPSTPEEAGAIWKELDSRSLTLEKSLRLYKLNSQNVADSEVNKLVHSLKIPLSDDANFVARAVKSGRSLITGPGLTEEAENQQLKSLFGSDRMAIVPLISQEGLQGVLLADNLITQKAISHADLKVLEIFARYASDAIENSRLYSRLEQQVTCLKEANEQIILSRKNLIKAEKLSSVAKMALDVAHEIRNPLTVIGGYANSCLSKLSPEDPSRQFFGIISKQANRIETALDRFSSVVTLSEKREGRFRLVTLVREALEMFSDDSNGGPPVLAAENDAEQLDVFLDQGLFYQVMMVLLRKSAEMVGGMANISLQVARAGQTGVIYILASDNFPNFAEKFYRALRDSKVELKKQETAVAIEILQHYGGGIGIISEHQGPMRLYVEFPLYREDV